MARFLRKKMSVRILLPFKSGRNQKQMNCPYCDSEFGDGLHRRVYEHFYPTLHPKHEHLILNSCQICNSIKNDTVFKTVKEVREFIRKPETRQYIRIQNA